MSILSTIIKNVVRPGNVLGQCRDYRAAVRHRQTFPIRKTWCDFIMPDNTSVQIENIYQQQKAKERCKLIKMAIQSKGYKPATKPYQYLRRFKFPENP
nr:unnamed protein product [Callosobruchus analis]